MTTQFVKCMHASRDEVAMVRRLKIAKRGAGSGNVEVKGLFQLVLYQV